MQSEMHTYLCSTCIGTQYDPILPKIEKKTSFTKFEAEQFHILRSSLSDLILEVGRLGTEAGHSHQSTTMGNAAH